MMWVSVIGAATIEAVSQASVDKIASLLARPVEDAERILAAATAVAEAARLAAEAAAAAAASEETSSAGGNA